MAGWFDEVDVPNFSLQVEAHADSLFDICSNINAFFKIGPILVRDLPAFSLTLANVMPPDHGNHPADVIKDGFFLRLPTVIPEQVTWSEAELLQSGENRVLRAARKTIEQCPIVRLSNH